LDYWIQKQSITAAVGAKLVEAIGGCKKRETAWHMIYDYNGITQVTVFSSFHSLKYSSFDHCLEI